MNFCPSREQLESCRRTRHLLIAMFFCHRKLAIDTIAFHLDGFDSDFLLNVRLVRAS